ncbi:MAG: F0F1 ATP synthase subunit A [Candidatus Kerfeldbacteria bacterium]|nr:F0F1 ATP synthase subunit A [Candidatus Kerfeldbacteria bacterium]
MSETTEQLEVTVQNTDTTIGGVEAAVAETETTTEAGHEPTLFAEPIAHLGGFTVTNSLLNSWLAVAIICLLAFFVSRKVKQIPRGIQNVFEIVVDGAMKLADSVTGKRAITEKIFPFVFTLFLFVLINNWLGLIPGIGSIGFLEMEEGHEIFVPLFRGGTADLNTTLALAIFTVIGSNVFGILIVGGWKYFNKFVNVQALVAIPGKVIKEPTSIIVNPIKFFVGIIEIIGEVAKIASLSFRLFGNIFAGEVLLASMAVIFAFVLPIPFMFLEIIVGLIQALIFSMLTLVYFSVAASSEEH